MFIFNYLTVEILSNLFSSFFSVPLTYFFPKHRGFFNQFASIEKKTVS